MGLLHNFQSSHMKHKLSLLNLTLRALMEFGIVLGLGFWGFQTGTTTLGKALLGVGLPICVFAFWGLVDFRHAGSIGEVLRLLQELLISGLAAAAVYMAGQPTLGWALALVSVVHHLMVYALGEKLLKGQTT
jgi:hypothetical protein